MYNPILYKIGRKTFETITIFFKGLLSFVFGNLVFIYNIIINMWAVLDSANEWLCWADLSSKRLGWSCPTNVFFFLEVGQTRPIHLGWAKSSSTHNISELFAEKSFWYFGKTLMGDHKLVMISILHFKTWKRCNFWKYA